MTYDEMKSYIEGVGRFGISLGLGRIRELLLRLSNPEKNLRVIHVAGTNGKGSFCTFISQILIEAGYKVGRYISPTLYGYRERLQINHEWIEKEAAAALMTRLKTVCEAMAADGFEYPTLFEIETAMAFLYFNERKCDFVVLEVGMGGLEDSTNVIEKPLLSVITAISRDHMAMLGSTISEIAVQKAGIIKKNCPVFTFEQEDGAMAVLQQRAQALSAPMTVADKNAVLVKKTGLSSQCFDYKSYKNLEIKMAGVYQIENAAAAAEAAKILMSLGISIKREAVYAGLKKAVWHGRFEVLSEKPYVIADGAHNEGGAIALRESIDTYFKGKRLIGLAGVFADKDYETILKLLMPYFKRLYTHKPEGSRGLDSGKLAAAAKEIAAQQFLEKEAVDAKKNAGNAVEAVEIFDAKTVTEAAKMALKAAAPDDVILSFGSLSTIGALSRYIKKG